MVENEKQNEVIHVMIISGSLITAITCIALIIYHVIEHVNNLQNVIILGLTGILSIGFMYYSINNMIKEKRNNTKA